MKLNLSNQILFIILYANTVISSPNSYFYHAPYSYSRIPPPPILPIILPRPNFPVAYPFIVIPCFQPGFNSYEGNGFHINPTFQDLPQILQFDCFQQYHSSSNSNDSYCQYDRTAKRDRDLYPRIKNSIEPRDPNLQSFHHKSPLKSYKNNNIGQKSSGITPEDSNASSSLVLSEQGPNQVCEYLNSYIYVITKYKELNNVFCFEKMKKEFLDKIYNEAIKNPGFPDELKNPYYKPKFFFLFVSMNALNTKKDFKKFKKKYYLFLQKGIKPHFNLSYKMSFKITASYFLFFEEDFVNNTYLKINYFRIGIFNLIISQLAPFCSSYPAEYFNRVSRMFSSFITNSQKVFQDIINNLDPLLDQFISKMKEINKKRNPSIIKYEINNCSHSIRNILIEKIFNKKLDDSIKIKENNHFFKILCALTIFPKSLIPEKDEFIKKAVIFLNHSNAIFFFNSFFSGFLLESIGFYNGVFDSENFKNFKILMDFIESEQNNMKNFREFSASFYEYLYNLRKWAKKKLSFINDEDKPKFVDLIKFLNSKMN